MDKLQTISWSDIFETIWSFSLYSLPIILIFSFVLFVISILILWKLRKKGLFQRKNKYWNWAVKINFIYIPALFVCLGIACGFLFSAKSYINDNHDIWLNPVSSTIVDGTLSILSDKEIMDEIQEKGAKVNYFIKTIFGDIQYQPKSNNFVERQKAFIANKIILVGMKWVFSMAIKKLLSDLSIRLHLGLEFRNDVIEFGEGVTDKINFSTLEDDIPHVLTKAIHSKIQGLLTSVYGHFFLTLCMFLLIPITEAIAYFYWYRNKYESLSNM